MNLRHSNQPVRTRSVLVDSPCIRATAQELVNFTARSMALMKCALPVEFDCLMRSIGILSSPASAFLKNTTEKHSEKCDDSECSLLFQLSFCRTKKGNLVVLAET